jgi:hypothetical protein
MHYDFMILWNLQKKPGIPPYGVHCFAWIMCSPSNVISIRLGWCCQNCSKKTHFGQKLIKSIRFVSAALSPLHMEWWNLQKKLGIMIPAKVKWHILIRAYTNFWVDFAWTQLQFSSLLIMSKYSKSLLFEPIFDGSSKMHSRKNAISHSLKGIYLIQGMRFTMEENAFPD